MWIKSFTNIIYGLYKNTFRNTFKIVEENIYFSPLLHKNVTSIAGSSSIASCLVAMIKDFISVSERFSTEFTFSSFFKIFQLIWSSIKWLKLHSYSLTHVHTEMYIPKSWSRRRRCLHFKKSVTVLFQKTVKFCYTVTPLKGFSKDNTSLWIVTVCFSRFVNRVIFSMIPYTHNTYRYRVHRS